MSILRAQPKKNAPVPVRAKPRPTNTRVRLYVVMMILALGSTALIVRAVDLQVVRKDFYQEQGDARFLREMPIPVSRGTIFDRNGEPLAVSTPVESIWANPQQLLDQPDRLPALAAALGIDASALQQKLEQHQDKEFVYLKRQLNPDDADGITKLGIAGVSAQREYKRYYPSGEVLAHVIGVTNVDDRGSEGLELAFDDWLAGTPGAEHVIRDNKGHTVEDVELLRDPKPGRDLTLSIDRRIQYMAYRELKSAIIEHHAMSGSMVVLDVQTGEVLAMVNQPSFNPNAHSNNDISYRRNRAMTDVVEPGSTAKAFTMATALESGQMESEVARRYESRLVSDRHVDHPRRPQPWRARSDRRHHEIEQHRRRENCRNVDARQPVRHVQTIRLRRIDGQWISWRIVGPSAHRHGVGTGRKSDDLVRLRPQRDAAATRAGVCRASQRRTLARSDVREGRTKSR